MRENKSKCKTKHVLIRHIINSCPALVSLKIDIDNKIWKYPREW